MGSDPSSAADFLDAGEKLIEHRHCVLDELRPAALEPGVSHICETLVSEVSVHLSDFVLDDLARG